MVIGLVSEIRTLLVPKNSRAACVVDPVKQLFWAAVINGVIAVPIMAVMMMLATRRDTMGPHVIGTRLRWLGWVATGAMAATVVAMLATLG